MKSKKAPIAKKREEVEFLIKKFDLTPHEEGGWFKQIYKSKDKIIRPGRVSAISRSCGTSIYYLLAFEDFSAWHRLKADETWHYHLGGELLIHTFNKKGNLETIVLGNPLNNKEAVPQYTVVADCWFAAQLKNNAEYSLVGCTVVPGFEYEDFELADREILGEFYPNHRDIIEKLTRKEIIYN